MAGEEAAPPPAAEEAPPAAPADGGAPGAGEGGEEKVEEEQEPAEVLPPPCINLEEHKLKVCEFYLCVKLHCDSSSDDFSSTISISSPSSFPQVHHHHHHSPRLTTLKEFTQCPMKSRRWTGLQTFDRSASILPFVSGFHKAPSNYLQAKFKHSVSLLR